MAKRSSAELPSVYRKTEIAEQSLILDSTEGLVVISGYTHQGVESIINLVHEQFPGKDIRLLLGGFHLESADESRISEISEYLMQSGLKAIAPSHCTGDRALALLRQ